MAEENVNIVSIETKCWTKTCARVLDGKSENTEVIKDSSFESHECPQ